MSLHLVPVRFRDACQMVADWHHHHSPPVGMKFCIGAATGDGELVGVVIVGRPVARFLDNGLTLEVLRLAVAEGVINACSMLYGAAWRAAKALGYVRLITYTHAGESGASLRGANYRVVAQRPARPGWDRPSRPRRPTGTENIARTLWEA
jgi:hypothetical protein